MESTSISFINPEFILNVKIKKDIFDLIESGIIKEDYRKMNAFWAMRLFEHESYHKLRQKFNCGLRKDLRYAHEFMDYLLENVTDLQWYPYSHIKFVCGQTARTMMFEIEDISISAGNPEDGAEAANKYFVIKLGQRTE